MTLMDDINTVKREIGRRRRTYAGLIQNRVLSQQTADLEIASMERVLTRLQNIDPKECRAKQYSDSMDCDCGLKWDVNDPHPPACPLLTLQYPACPHGHGNWQNCVICCASDKDAE